MQSITIVTPCINNRLKYVCQWLFGEIFSIDYSFVLPSEKIDITKPIIFYGIENSIGFSIPDARLLWEKDISEKGIKIGSWENIPTLFAIENESSISFDLFSAIFYLISRYEEYLTFTPDKHRRFPHTKSILYQNGWLTRPLVDEWLFQFKILLEKIFHFSIPLPEFSFKPTYDIDIAYSYKNKGILRWVGALSNDFLKGNFQEINSRFSVLVLKIKDPFDCFDWLKKTHEELSVSPIYFILASQKNTAFDKNNLPSKPAMKALISSLSKQGKIGLHPSYFSNENSVFFNEKSALENIIGNRIILSRQHYIRLLIPYTYRFLIQHGISDDYSMGYGAALGFRAGTGRSFYWFDLEKNEQTDLRIHPFCFMDSTAHYEEKMSTQESEKTLLEMLAFLKKTNSQMITVFHNFSLGSAPEWEGWSALYYSFLKKITS